MNVLLQLAFDGGGYHGFQVQKNAVTVCGVLQDAMEKLFGSRPDVKGCSRTDAGVHARSFCLSFFMPGDIPCEKLPLALNAHLPRDVRVFAAKEVPDDFHARYSAVGKQYRYLFLNAAADDPFLAGRCYRVAGPLDEEAMQAAGQALVGRHDFAAFASAGGSAEDTVRTVRELAVRRQGAVVAMYIAADGFLYNMVRIVAGTLLQVGTKRKPPEWVEKVLLQKNRALAGDTLPAAGLSLERVEYPVFCAQPLYDGWL